MDEFPSSLISKKKGETERTYRESGRRGYGRFQIVGLKETESGDHSRERGRLVR
jgi:hypothetical protein